MSIKRARELRKAMTPQEVKLWLQLRSLKSSGFHFRRQAPLLGYYPDFVCFSRRLIVELDGSQHADDARQIDHDYRRDAVLRGAGFRVLRFWNGDVDEEMDGVVLSVLDALSEAPHPTAPRLPSP